jgi:hypothetical protein
MAKNLECLFRVLRWNDVTMFNVVGRITAGPRYNQVPTNYQLRDPQHLNTQQRQDLQDFQKQSRTLMSGTALSGRCPISGRFSVRSDSFHRQNVQRLVGLACGSFTRGISPAPPPPIYSKPHIRGHSPKLSCSMRFGRGNMEEGAKRSGRTEEICWKPL